jgi:transcription elongation GreA/GreB family factor
VSADCGHLLYPPYKSNFPAIDKEIHQLRCDLEEARKLAEAAARQAFADAEAKIEQLAARLGRSEVLDLR